MLFSSAVTTTVCTLVGSGATAGVFSTATSGSGLGLRTGATARPGEGLPTIYFFTACFSEGRRSSRLPRVRSDFLASGFLTRRPLWLGEMVNLEAVRQQSFEMEEQAYRFYTEAVKQTTDAEIRKLLGDLAMEEKAHEHAADALEEEHLGAQAVDAESKEARRQFLLTYVQPGLAGLMDGSVSTLAPVFAAAFATQDTHQTFLVGLAAAVGAGISMGFTEAAADDGKLTGRGSPIARGIACGVMTALGGLGHALPYLIPHFWIATVIAMCVVVVELVTIAFIQNRYMSTPFFRAALQVILGGALVFAAGILIGRA